MARLNLTGNTTVAELKKAFNDAFGSQIKVYNGGIEAGATTCLSKLGLKEYGELECRSSLTAGKFIERMAERGLKVAVWTRDYHVKVLDGLTLESTGKVKNMARKSDMENMIAYQRKDETNALASGGNSEKKKMKKYTVDITIGGTSDIHWSKIYNKSEKEIDAEIEEEIKKGNIFDFIDDFIESNDDNRGLIMNDVYFFDDCTSFEMEVRDENGNVVFESNEPNCLSDTDDDDYASPYVGQYPGDGIYLFEHWRGNHWLMGEFKTDDFKPSKFHIACNPELECIMNSDNVDFCKLIYGSQYIDMEDMDGDWEDPICYKAKLVNRRGTIVRID